MDAELLAGLGGLFVWCVVSGIVPLVNAEVLVLGAAAALPSSVTPLVVLVSSVGQMLSKTVLFAAAGWAPHRLPGRARRTLEKGRAQVVGRDGGAGGALLASAFVGVPPFYLLTLVAGALRVRPATFLCAGLTGRLARFGVIAWAGRGVAWGLFG